MGGRYPVARRRAFILVISCCLVCATAACGLTRSGQRPPRAVQLPGPFRFGLAYGDRLSFMTPADLAATLDAAVRLGAGWIRADLGWDAVQADGAGEFRWAAFDRVVTAADARNLRVLPILAYTPPWARDVGCVSAKCAPASPAAFARFAGAAAARYAPLGLHTWEVWNEPNMTGFWRPAPDPTRYLAVLRAAAGAIRAADPAAYLVSGGLAAVPSTDGDITELDFLGRMCSLGLGGIVNAVGYHPYTFPYLPSFRAPWAVGTAWNRIGLTSPSVESVLRDCGPRRLVVWLTEYGAPTFGPGRASTDGRRPAPGDVDHVDERLQAAIGADAVRLAASTPGIAALFWYTDRDLSSAPGASTENFYGLRRADGSAKPAYAAIQHEVAVLRSAQPRR
jgi:hypothetical protein